MPSIKSFTIAQTKSFTEHLPFVSKVKYQQVCQALEEANHENKKAIVTMFQLKRAADRRVLEETRRVYELFLGYSWEFGGCKFKVR